MNISLLDQRIVSLVLGGMLAWDLGICVQQMGIFAYITLLYFRAVVLSF